MASTVSRPLLNFCLPPWSILTAMATNSTAIPTAPNQKTQPSVRKRSRTLIINKCNVSSTSDRQGELPNSKSSSPMSAAIKTQPQASMADLPPQPEPPKLENIAPPIQKKTLTLKKRKRFSITLLRRKEIQEDVLKIAESLGRKRGKRSKKPSKDHKRLLNSLFPGFEYIKPIS
ncbi:hypothetical protein CCACVL1_06724 [Corchorus capsularis]|uniref:Uncharacterized protein n=1 Tax=Corchorus capsularis TaxID=210143 RepID=A0A1R3JDK8_COCAP|nr:hypothetical protein CCACVL1_06724 [Corchorus capsularis]